MKVCFLAHACCVVLRAFL